jgi:Zn-dependent protease with chaperone function
MKEEEIMAREIEEVPVDGRKATFQDMRDLLVLFLITGPLVFAILYTAELMLGIQNGLIIGFMVMVGCFICALAVSYSYYSRTQQD